MCVKLSYCSWLIIFATALKNAFSTPTTGSPSTNLLKSKFPCHFLTFSNYIYQKKEFFGHSKGCTKVNKIFFHEELIFLNVFVIWIGSKSSLAVFWDVLDNYTLFLKHTHASGQIIKNNFPSLYSTREH
jgi:hypothetical protein